MDIAVDGPNGIFSGLHQKKSKTNFGRRDQQMHSSCRVGADFWNQETFDATTWIMEEQTGKK